MGKRRFVCYAFLLWCGRRICSTQFMEHHLGWSCLFPEQCWQIVHLCTGFSAS